MRKKIKILSVGLSILISFATAYSISIPASATTYYRSIDNDSIAAGYGNLIWPPSAVYVYFESSGLYNGDARYTSSSYSNTSYTWTYPGLTFSDINSCYFKIGAYLNHYSFNDPSADYSIEYYPGLYKHIGYIDQDDATCGWNYTYRTVSHTLLPAAIYTSGISVQPSGTNNYRTGADAACAYISP